MRLPRCACLCLATFFLACECLAMSGVHDTVQFPLPDYISLFTPVGMPKQKYLGQGALDVSAEPFSADPTGKRDSTVAIQRAINMARDYQLVCLFPKGRYLVSGTLKCVQQRYKDTLGRVVSGRHYPNVLMASSRRERATLVLADNSPGFDKPDSPKSVVEFMAQDVADPARHELGFSFNQLLVNLDVEIGKNNPGAVGVTHYGAQGSGIYNCTIDATQGRTGIRGGIGGGGGFYNVKVVGGETGIEILEPCPGPILVNVDLINQTKYAIVYGGRETLTCVGVRISKPGGTAIKTVSKNFTPFYGQLSLVDCTVDFTKTAGIGVETSTSCYIRNSYFHNAMNAVVQAGDGLLPGLPTGWGWVEECALGFAEFRYQEYVYSGLAEVDGSLAKRFGDRMVPSPPPVDLQGGHAKVDVALGLFDPHAHNVKDAPFFAKGDGIADDTAPLQKAIDSGGEVFLPKGIYRITKTLRLKKGTKLSGVARHLSVLLADMKSASFSDPARPQPLVQTSEAADGGNGLSLVGLFVPRGTPGGYALQWSCGGDSTLSCVNFDSWPPVPNDSKRNRTTPLVVVSGNGAGVWDAFFQEDWFQQAAGYRHMLVKGTAGPFRVYQFNVEHARGAANAELESASNVVFYAVKAEGNAPVLRLSNCRDVAVYGYAGNAAAFEKAALFEVAGCRNLRLANLVDCPRLPGMGSLEAMAGVGVDPRLWQMVKSDRGGGTPPLLRPVLYRED